MGRRSERPPGSHAIDNYAEFVKYTDAWIGGNLNLLIVVGDPGLGKTRLVLDRLAWKGHDPCLIEGSATAFGMYCKLYSYVEQWEAVGADQRVVIDDCDKLLLDRSCTRLLKCLCQTEECKRVMWESAAQRLEAEGIPRSFETNSRVCIIANDWKSISVNAAAIEDRGHVIFFKPNPTEVHTMTAAWFWQQEVYDCIGQHVNMISNLSMRHYYLAAELRQSGLDWQAPLYDWWGLSQAVLIAYQLLHDDSYKTEAARVAAFKAKTGKSQSMYYNYIKRFAAPSTIPPIKVRGREPKKGDKYDLLAALRERFGDLGDDGSLQVT